MKLVNEPGNNPLSDKVAKRRARARDTEQVTGVKPHQSGTPNMSGLLRRVRRREWADVEPHAVEVGELVGWINSVTMTAQRTVNVQISIPLEYAADAMELAELSSLHFALARWYVVPRRLFTEQDE